MTDKLREAAQQAEREAFERALAAKPDARFWNAADAMFWAWQARAALAQHSVYQLPDDLYPDSKCWVDGTYAERVEWLHTMYESSKQTLNVLLGQRDAQTVPTQRQYEMALRQWDHWKSYALELQAKLVKYEGGSPMVLNTAPTPPAQRVMLTDEEIDEVWNSIAGHSIYAEYQMEIANAMIEAYERKNGIK